MIYPLRINGTWLENVSSLEIIEFYRSESVTYTLSGSMTVDRVGKSKLKISATVSGISPETMKILRNAVRLSTETVVSTYRDGEFVQKKMRVLPFTEPEPIYFYGNPSNLLDGKYIYSSVELEMEEV